MTELTELVKELRSSIVVPHERRQEERTARDGYEGHSWGYHGHVFITARDKAERAAVAALDEYVKAKIAEALEEKP